MGAPADWDPAFWQRSPLFWAIAPAAARLASFASWPAPEDLACLFPGEPEVRFALAAPRPRRARASDGPSYDARISADGVVPTRARSWHDLLNALVWATFPRAKRALHARQHAMIAARTTEGRVPGARTAEQDAVAMLDEGGAVILCAPSVHEEVARAVAGHAGDASPFVRAGTAKIAIFGHGVYEGLVAGGPPAVYGAAFVLAADAPGLHVADAALAAWLARPEPITRGLLGSVRIDEGLADAMRSRADLDP